jgi:hypothetical protein
MIFRCEIEMDNDDMRTPQDLTRALQIIIKQVQFYSAGFLPVKLNVRDDDGNTVGDWSILEE